MIRSTIRALKIEGNSSMVSRFPRGDHGVETYHLPFDVVGRPSPRQRHALVLDIKELTAVPRIFLHRLWNYWAWEVVTEG